MPIVAYTGLPGHGKSHTAVEHVILPALRAGRCVVTNLALNLELVRKDFPGCDVRPFDIDALREAPATVDELWPPGCVVVVDEAWKLWPAGQAADKAPLPFRSILAEHRHRVNEAGDSMQVVIVTQDLMQISSFARQLVEQTFRTVKLNALGMSKRFRVDIYNGPACGPNPPEKNRVSQTAGSYSAKVWRYYTSHTKSQGGEGANEKSVDRRIVVWRSPVWWLVAPLVLGAFGFGVWRVWMFFHPAPPAAVAPGRRDSSKPVRGLQGVPPRRASGAWRVSGTVLYGNADGVAYLTDDRVYVALSVRQYCDIDVAGFVVCNWNGERISSQVRELPRGLPSQTLSMFGQPMVSAGPAAAVPGQ